MIFEFYRFEELIATIEADYKSNRVVVTNYTDDIMDRPFGRKDNITWSDWEYFLESRCFPRTRDHADMILQEMGLDHYSPLDIVLKTEGRMAEDHFWLKNITE